MNPILSEGQRAPAFTLTCQDGSKVRLTSLRGKWVVLYFYPKDSTPGCTRQAIAFRDLHHEFEDENCVILGLCPDDRASHESFAGEHDLPFHLLVDRDSRVAHRYGVWREKSRNGHQYLGIVRSTFVIDPDGRIFKIWDNVRVKGHVDKVLSSLKTERAL